MPVSPVANQESPRLVLARGAISGVVTAVALQLKSDPDLWGHLRLGLDFWSTFTIPTLDRYSFTSDRSWINHEWLWDVVITAFYRLGGTIALALFAAAIALAAVTVARSSAHRSGMGGWRAELLCVLAFLLGVAPLVQTMRAQAFSSLLFVGLMALLREIDRGERKALVVLPMMFLMWANLHGAWVMAGGVLVVWTAVSMLVATTHRVRAGLAMAGLLSAAATLVNPYGVELWQFLGDTIRFGRADIVEWGSLTSAPIMFVPWFITAAIGFASVPRLRREHMSYVAVCLMLGAASFRVMRVVPFFSIAVLMLLGPLFVSRKDSPGLEAQADSAGTFMADWRLTVRELAGAFLIWAVCVASVSASGRPIGCLARGNAFALDERAGAFLRENAVSGRLLVWFDWGEYVHWHLGPELKVSMDGRRETVYSEAFIAAHREFYRNGPEARAFLDRLQPDFIWLPKSIAVSASLAGWGWTPVFETDTSIVWGRASHPSRAWRQPAPIASACFPSA